MPKINTDNMIFVFGSNLSGIHGAGAAKYAELHRGAKRGVGIGRTGQAYAIPTKDAQIRHTLPLGIIKPHVEGFIQYAKFKSNMLFQVTCIGCGLAGLEHWEIAPMFEAAPKNCWFDTNWGELLPEHNFWGSF